MPPLTGLARCAAGGREGMVGVVVVVVVVSPVMPESVGKGSTRVTLKDDIRNLLVGLIVKKASPLIRKTGVRETMIRTDAPTMPRSSVPFGWRSMTIEPPISM